MTKIAAAAVFLMLAAVLPSNLAAPTVMERQMAGKGGSSGGPVVLIAAHSTSPVHLQTITASNQSFYIGKETVTYCPLEDVSACPAGNVTAVDIGGGEGRAAMDVAVPGGQAIYIRPTGALSFTFAHSAGPPGIDNGTFITTGFSYVNGTGEGTLGTFSWRGGRDWLACPVDGSVASTGPWQVFAALPNICDADVPGGNLSACIGFDALGSPYVEDEPAAWQYE